MEDMLLPVCRLCDLGDETVVIVACGESLARRDWSESVLASMPGI